MGTSRPGGDMGLADGIPQAPARALGRAAGWAGTQLRRVA